MLKQNSLLKQIKTQILAGKIEIVAKLKAVL